MRSSRSILGTGLAVLVVLAFPGAGAQTLDRIVAVVQNDPILESELKAQVQFHIMNNRLDPATPGIQDQVLQSMINEKLIVAKAIIDSVDVSDEEVQQQMDRVIQQRIQQVGSEQKLEEILRDAAQQDQAGVPRRTPEESPRPAVAAATVRRNADQPARSSGVLRVVSRQPAARGRGGRTGAHLRPAQGQRPGAHRGRQQDRRSPRQHPGRRGLRLPCEGLLPGPGFRTTERGSGLGAPRTVRQRV